MKIGLLALLAAVGFSYSSPALADSQFQCGTRSQSDYQLDVKFYGDIMEYVVRVPTSPGYEWMDQKTPQNAMRLSSRTEGQKTIWEYGTRNGAVLFEVDTKNGQNPSQHDAEISVRRMEQYNGAGAPKFGPCRSVSQF